jgi:hypothetical protein
VTETLPNTPDTAQLTEKRATLGTNLLLHLLNRQFEVQDKGNFSHEYGLGPVKTDAGTDGASVVIQGEEFQIQWPQDDWRRRNETDDLPEDLSKKKTKPLRKPRGETPMDIYLG